MFRILENRSHMAIQIALALLCIAVAPAVQAHAGHHREHRVAKAAGGDFTLSSGRGAVSLKDFRGKVVAIYFGYTHCTDVCPLDLAKLGRAIKLLKPEEDVQVQAIFITLDPARDDAKRMAEYSASFHPRLMGLTGSEAEVAAVAMKYGVHYEKGAPDDAGNYDIEHPSDIFMIGHDGKLLRSLPGGYTPSSIATALRFALQSGRK